MTDQCRHCQLRGNLKACMAIECSKHEDWYPQQLQQQNDKLTADNAALVEENQALRNELDKYKKQVANDDKHLEKASFVELERDQLRNELEALRGTTMGVDLSKDYTNKIKADAVMSIMKLDYDCETPNGDSAWSSNTIEEYANKLEQSE